MLIYNMHKEHKFPMAITNLAALFLELSEPPSYFYSGIGLLLSMMIIIVLKKQYTKQQVQQLFEYIYSHLTLDILHFSKEDSEGDVIVFDT